MAKALRQQVYITAITVMVTRFTQMYNTVYSILKLLVYY